MMMSSYLGRSAKKDPNEIYFFIFLKFKQFSTILRILNEFPGKLNQKQI
jgi:hypothetical protein